jgi:hypothetical protein
MGPPPSLDDRLRAVEGLTRVFRLERMAYVTATALSFLALFAVAVRLLIRGQGSLAEWGLLFGSSGLITLTASGLLRMWNQAIRLVASEPVDGTASGGKDA